VGSGTSKLEIAATPTSNFKLADSEMRISGCKASVTVGGDDKSSEETTKVASSSSSSEETPEETTSSDVTTIAEVTTASEKVTETTTEITTVVETDDVKTTFNDIQNYPWAVDFIENLAAQKIINGYSDGSFKPADNIKRADFVMMLMKAIGEDVSNTNGKSFDDVDSGAYYAGAVCTAKNLGIANGNGDGTFSPSSNITRQDMMLLAKNAIEYKTGKKTEGNVSVLDGFNDKAEISAYAQNGLAAMVEAGIINGTGKSIEPKANTTRAQAAVVIYKIINYKA
jgi:beta-glucosidase